MKAIRRFIGAVLGPIVGTAFYVFLRVVNIGKHWQGVREDDTSALLLRGARCVPKSAITFGQHIFCERRAPNFALVRHELVHVRQYRRFGWVGFLARYGAEQASVGYRANRLEQEARSVAGL